MNGRVSKHIRKELKKIGINWKTQKGLYQRFKRTYKKQT